MILNTPTMFVAIIAISAILAAAIAFIAYRRQQDLLVWAVALAMHGVAYTLFGLRGQISDFISIVVGNFALASVFALFGEAIYLFQGRSSPRWLLWPPVVIVTISFVFLLNDQQTRFVVSGLVFSLQCVFILVAVFDRRYKTVGRGQYLLATGVIVVLGLLLFRALAVLVGGVQLGSFTDTNPMQGFALLLTVLATLSLALGLVTMNQERLGRTAASATAKLRSSEQHYRLLIESANEGIGVAEAGIMRFVNPELLKLTGYDKNEILGHRFADFIHEDDREVALANYQMRLQGQIDKLKYVVRVVTKHKGVRWFEINGTLFDWEGQPATLNFLNDITEREWVEAALRQSEQRYRTLTEWSPEPLVVHDGTKFIYVNPAAVKLFGANSAPDLVGRPIFDRVHPDFRKIVGARMNLRPEPGGTFPTREIRFLKLDGTTIDVEVQSTSITYDDVAAIQVAMRDITERKHDHAMLLQQAQRSEALLRLPAAADTMNERDFLQHGLGMAEQLTGSLIAFVHFVHDDQETIEALTWSKATPSDYCSATADNHYPISQAGIWTDSLRQRKAVLINDYASAVGKRGLPEGHTHLERLISVPVIEGGLVRMMMGVGNKPQPYTDLDVETTRLVAQALYRIVSKHRSDEAMHQSQASLKEAQRIARVGSYTLDASKGHWDSSEELDRLFGINASFERSVQGWEALIHPEDRAMMSAYFQNQVVGQHKIFDKEYRVIRKDSQAERWVHGLGRLTFDAQGGLQKMIGTIQDITERKQAESQIQALAFSDPLTGLPNRRLLMDRLEQALVAVFRHDNLNALVFIDLDNFKTLNDTLGHDKGDSLLKQVAQRLTACVRAGDTVSRLGGDEFVVLLEDLGGDAPQAAKQAQLVTAKILKALGQPYELDGHGYHSSASLGVTLFGGTLSARPSKNR